MTRNSEKFIICKGIPLKLKKNSKIQNRITITNDSYWTTVSFGKKHNIILYGLLKKESFFNQIKKVHLQNPYDSNNNSIFILGVSYKIIIDAKIKNYHFDSNILYINYDERKYSLFSYLSHLSIVLSKKYFQVLVNDTINNSFEKYKNEMNISKIKIRNMKTRWGINKIIGNQNQITLNSKLIHYPKEYIIYVIQHELAHCIFHNHSKEYYEFLNKINSKASYYKKTLIDFKFTKI